MSGLVIPSLFEDCMGRQVHLPVFSDDPFWADENRGVVNHSLCVAFFGHAKYNVDTVFSRSLFDLACTGTGDRLCKIVDFVAHSVAGEMEFREDQQIDILPSSLAGLIAYRSDVPLLVEKL